MRKHLQTKALLLGFVAVLGLGWSALASPETLTVTPYADLVRFSGEGQMQVQIFTLAGMKIFSAESQNTLDWSLKNIASGVYLYTVKSADGKQRIGKVAVIRGRGQVAPPLITTPSVSDPNKVEPKWTLCANPCSEVHQGDITIQTTTATSWAKFDSVNQRLGLGLLNPSYRFHLAGDGPGIDVVIDDYTSSTGVNPTASFRKAGGTQAAPTIVQNGDQLGSFNWFGYDGASFRVSATVATIVTGTPSSGIVPTSLIFKTMNTSGVWTERMRITDAGNLGIGTTAPSGQLHVNNTNNQPGLRIDSNNGTNAIEVYNTGTGSATGLIFRVARTTGNVYANGSYNCGLTTGSCFNAGTGADVAERIDAVEAMEAGDVVEIHPDQAGKFRKSQSAISRRVAGIISTAPAVTLGNNFDGNKEKWSGDNRPLLALAGRVPVKVLAKYGAIQVGDLLVSSPIPGYAMKCPEASQCIGAVIGKALEPLAEGVGKIEVQVMLR